MSAIKAVAIIGRWGLKLSKNPAVLEMGRVNWIRASTNINFQATAVLFFHGLVEIPFFDDTVYPLYGFTLRPNRPQGHRPKGRGSKEPGKCD
jgi:hypothetical protein